jgi:hypothetical protein
MKRSALLALTLLAGCASKPADYAATLSMQDPKWETPECKEIRLAAVNYNDKVGSRVAIGLVSGLLLGPFGIPIAAAADANQDQVRKQFNREVHLRCSSLPLPEKMQAKPPATAKASTGR